MELNKNSVLMCVSKHIKSHGMEDKNANLLVVCINKQHLVFASSLQYKNYVLDALNFPFTMWLQKRNFLSKLLHNNLDTQNGLGELIQIIVVYCVGDAPLKCDFPKHKINKSQFKDIVVSDQFVDGSIGCGTCIAHKSEQYISLTKYNDEWWFNHLNSEIHINNTKNV